MGAIGQYCLCHRCGRRYPSAPTQRRILANLDLGDRPLRVNRLLAQGAVAQAGSAQPHDHQFVEVIAPVPAQWSAHVLVPVRKALRAARTAARLNARLVQGNKLAVIGQIAAGAGHEINQLLAAIAAYADNGQRYADAGQLFPPPK